MKHVHTRTEWRIASKVPGERRWRFIPFTYATARDEAGARARIAQCEREACNSGYKFRVERREVRIESGDWTPVEPIPAPREGEGK